MSRKKPKSPKKPRGAPTKFDPEKASRVLDAFKLGALVQDAAAFAGVTRQCLHDWMKRGALRPIGDPLRDFVDAVSQQRSSTKVQTVGKVLLAASRDWKAGAWWLGVTDPKNYGPKIRVTLEEEFTNALQRIEKRLPPDVFTAVLQAIAEGDGPEDAAGPEAPEV